MEYFKVFNFLFTSSQGIISFLLIHSHFKKSAHFFFTMCQHPQFISYENVQRLKLVDQILIVSIQDYNQYLASINHFFTLYVTRIHIFYLHVQLYKSPQCMILVWSMFVNQVLVAAWNYIPVHRQNLYVSYMYSQSCLCKLLYTQINVV